MPIYHASDSVRAIAYGMEMAWRDTNRYRGDDTARVCGPHGQAKPFPSVTVRLLPPAATPAELPGPQVFSLSEIANRAIEEVRVDVLPRPVADLFASIACGNIYVDGRVCWFPDDKRSTTARELARQAAVLRASASFQSAASTAAIASGMVLSAALTSDEKANADRAIFEEAWAILISLIDQQAFMELVGEILNTHDWAFATSKWAKSVDFWRRAFDRRPATPIDGIIRSVGDERRSADKARCAAAYAKRTKQLAKRVQNAIHSGDDLAAHRLRMAMLRNEVSELTKHAR